MRNILNCTNLEGQYSRGFSEFRTTSILIEAETVSRPRYILCHSGICVSIKSNVSLWAMCPGYLGRFFPKCAVSSQFCELGPRFSCKVSVAFSLNG